MLDRQVAMEAGGDSAAGRGIVGRFSRWAACRRR